MVSQSKSTQGFMGPTALGMGWGWMLRLRAGVVVVVVCFSNPLGITLLRGILTMAIIGIIGKVIITTATATINITSSISRCQ